MIRTTSHRARAVALGAAGAMVLAGTVALAGPAVATPGGATACEKRTNNTVAKLTDCVTLDGVMEHLEAFQQIATDNGGNRASGTPGYDASADYVQQRLEKAGWEVSRQQFEFPFFQLNSSAFSQVAPDAATYAEGTDYAVMTYSASGDVTATVQAVDVVLPPPATANGNTSGCEAADFAGFTAGNIALVQRGTCNFGQKVANAQAAGASAVVVFNEGQEGRTDVVQGTLGAPGATIPAIGVTYALGSTLGGDTLRVAVQAVSEFRNTENVTAELPGRTSDNVVMAGAHLDSVPAGAGINDNGSGSAALIEVAENLTKSELPNTVRFAWWGAEELGLLGSKHYVSQLDQAQREDLALYLNFDMVGSPNFARFIYDGDQSAFTVPPPTEQNPFFVPEGSAQIEYVFEDFYEEQELFYEGTEFSGRSDYQAFAIAGIPSGGLFTGAEGVKQAYQAEAYGGTAGVAYDPNYHQVGDDIANLDPEALEQNSDAIAYAVLTLGYDTQRVNGVAGRPVPGGTFEGDPENRQYRISAAQANGGGGLHAGHDHDHGSDTA
ncbi:M20/M25/M40 family metallo-hydrolase [Geodermatophilus sp. URMC 60]